MFNRTENAKRTIMWGMILKVFSLVVPFAMRTIIIYTLGNLYLGLNSLFTSILNALNLAELGVGSALVFAMYKPINEGDITKVQALLNVYKKVYLIIGIVVASLGFALLPFISFFISGEYPQGVDIYLIYIIQLLSTVAGYFFMAYKGSILVAYQKVYIVNALTIVTQSAMYLVQILALLILKNYYVYISATVVWSVAHNLIIALIVKRKFPNIRPLGKIDKETQKDVFKKTGALMGHKVSAVIINSIDNIFISAFIGLEIVAFYNNYYYIITALSGIFLMLTNGLQSIVGNYLLNSDKKESEKMFQTLSYIVAFAICFCCTCLINLFQPFIRVWTGEESLLSFSSVLLFVLLFFFIKIRTVVNLFIDSAGLWEKNIIASYILIVIDLVLDIWLLQTIGVNGAIISTICAMLFAFIYDSVVLYKYHFNGSVFYHLTKSFFYFIVTGISCVVSLLICNFIQFDSMWQTLLSNLWISVLVSLVSFFLITFWTKEFRESVGFVEKRIFKL